MDFVAEIVEMSKKDIPGFVGHLDRGEGIAGRISCRDGLAVGMDHLNLAVHAVILVFALADALTKVIRLASTKNLTARIILRLHANRFCVDTRDWEVVQADD